MISILKTFLPRKPLNLLRKVSLYKFCNTNDDSKDDDINDGETKYVEYPILPLYLSEFDATETFIEWSKKQRLGSSKFRLNPKGYINNIEKYYIPFYHFNSSVRTQYHASTTPNGKKDVYDTVSCQYPSNLKNMQIIGNNKMKELLNENELEFILGDFPLGETQFQRMKFSLPLDSYILPVDIGKNDAEIIVQNWLKSEENMRMNQYMEKEKLYDALFNSNFVTDSRIVYIPIYIIYFNDNNNINQSRCIINGNTGNIIGKRIVSMIQLFKLSLFINSLIFIPLGKAMYFPLKSTIMFSGIIGSIFPFLIKIISFNNNKLYILDNKDQNTTFVRFKQKQMQDKEIEDAIESSKNAWGSYTSKNRVFMRQHESLRDISFKRMKGIKDDNDYTFGSNQTDGTYEKWQHSKFEYESSSDNDNTDKKGKIPKRQRVGFTAHTQLYEILGIKANATTEDVQNAFTSLAKVHHPDRLENLSEEEREEGKDRFSKILLAFQVLKDPDRRELYDKTGETSEKKFKQQKKANKQNNTNNDNNT